MLIMHVILFPLSHENCGCCSNGNSHIVDPEITHNYSS